jgi:hypothetical protein
MFVLLASGTAFAQLDDRSATVEGIILPAADAAPVPVAPSAWSAPPLHIGLGATFVVLQALDVTSTLDASRSGKGVEANPLMSAFVNHPFAFGAVKGAASAATLLTMKRLAKNHPKTAVLTYISLNAVYGLTVASNLRIANARK